VLDQRLHEPEQQRQQQRADVLAVDVGVGHQHDLVVAQLVEVELLVMPVPSAEMIAWTSVLASTLSMRAFSTLRILPRIGRIAWMTGSRPCLAEPPAESPSTMKTSHSLGPWTGSRQLAGQTAAVQQALAVAGQVAGLARRHPGRCGLGLADDVLALGRVLLQPVAELVVDQRFWTKPLDLGVAELGLGLALELRLAELDRDDRGQALADVVAGEVPRPSP
jgi:hypothetical protein